MTEWEFDVAVSSHDLLQLGITEAGYANIRVLAADYDDASLLACQMAAIYGMPTAAYIRI